ncbi:MAG: hypothetical protein R3E53_07860 [Myxococcota bacterium]
MDEAVGVRVASLESQPARGVDPDVMQRAPSPRAIDARTELAGGGACEERLERLDGIISGRVPAGREVVVVVERIVDRVDAAETLGR